MRAGQLDLLDLELPIVLRTAAPLSDEDLMRFSDLNKPYKVERNRDGDIILRAGAGGIESIHEAYLSRELGEWPGQVPETLDRPETVAATAPVAGFTLLCSPFWSAQ